MHLLAINSGRFYTNLTDYPETATRLLHQMIANIGETVHPNPYLFRSENKNRGQQ